MRRIAAAAHFFASSLSRSTIICGIIGIGLTQQGDGEAKAIFLKKKQPFVCQPPSPVASRSLPIPGQGSFTPVQIDPPEMAAINQQGVDMMDYKQVDPAPHGSAPDDCSVTIRECLEALPAQSGQPAAAAEVRPAVAETKAEVSVSRRRVLETAAAGVVACAVLTPRRSAADDLTIEFSRRINGRLTSISTGDNWPGPQTQTRKEIAQWVRDEAWGHHASCSCRMGAAGDPQAVVDSKFRVRGTRGLRIVDASVFPRIPGYFILMPIYMISQKAAAEILKDARTSASYAGSADETAAAL